MSKPEAFIDTHRLEEDARIDLIGRTVMASKKTACFITDADPGKADRYIRKLKKRFPGILILEVLKGPVPNTVLVKVAPPNEQSN